MPLTYSQYQQQGIQGQALKDIGRLGLVMAGLGMGWRGLEGLGNVYRRNTRERPPSLMHAEYVDIPAGKQAGVLEDFGSQVWDPMVQAAKGNVSHRKFLPWYLPGLVGAAGLGAYGGWKATDSLLDSRRKSEIDSEMEQARQNYLAALQGGTKLGAALDAFCDEAEKQGSALMSPDTAGAGMQVLGTLLGLGTVASGMWAYDATRKKRPGDVLEEAKRREARLRMQARPSPVYARLAPTGSTMSPRPTV